jgi:hypothetical protein
MIIDKDVVLTPSQKVALWLMEDEPIVQISNTENSSRLSLIMETNGEYWIEYLGKKGGLYESDCCMDKRNHWNDNIKALIRKRVNQGRY